MKRIIYVALVLLVSMFLMATCFAQSIPSLSDRETASSTKTIRLFNGRNLDGWYPFLQNRKRNEDPNKVFTVKKKMIHISGEEYGVIVTNEEYENYTLIVEFKWGKKTSGNRVNKARDNGILLHSVGSDGGFRGLWMHSIECQIIEGGTGDFYVVGDGSNQFAITATVGAEKSNGNYIYQKDGKPVTINDGRISWYGRDPEWKDIKKFRGRQDIEKPTGKWNRLECIAKGDKITIILNGVLVNEATNVKPNKGRIQIQTEGAEIFFRRVDLLQSVEPIKSAS